MIARGELPSHDFLAEILECGAIEGFGPHVSDLFFGANFQNFDSACLNMFFEVVILDGKRAGSGS